MAVGWGVTEVDFAEDWVIGAGGWVGSWGCGATGGFSEDTATDTAEVLADGAASVAEWDGGFVSTVGGAAAGLDTFVALLTAGTRRRKVEDESSVLEVVASGCVVFAGATGGLILILLVTLFEYSGKLWGGGRSDINCLK